MAEFLINISEKGVKFALKINLLNKHNNND